MDALGLFAHLRRFDAGMVTAGQLWNYLSEHSFEAEEDLDDEALEVFDTAELVLAEYTSGHITEDAARERLRLLLTEDGHGDIYTPLEFMFLHRLDLGEPFVTPPPRIRLVYTHERFPHLRELARMHSDVHRRPAGRPAPLHRKSPEFRLVVSR